MTETIHQGRNIKRFRELFGIKQEALAIELGDDWNQKKVSLLESKEVIDDGLLEQVAKVLKVPVEAIKHFTEERAINVVANTFNQESFIGYQKLDNCNFNPLDKLLELHQELIALYERMIKEKEAMIDRMQRVLDEHK